jgi:riboflavin biosynthesis pyrimidine reductase
VIDELSILFAPAVDGALRVTGVFEVPGPAGLAGKARLRLTSNETLAHGLVHLRYAVESA